MTDETQIETTEIIEPEPEPKPEPARVPVRVIEVRGKSALIQTADFQRYYAPASKVKDGSIAQDDLDQCPTYGVPLEAYLGLGDVTADALALMLRQAGIYTLADLQVRDRQLIRIGTNLIGRVVRDAAQQAAKAKQPPRSKRNAK
jgi:hypothetical protein